MRVALIAPPWLPVPPPAYGGTESVVVVHLLDAYDAARDYVIVHDHTIAGPVYADRYDSLPVVTTNHGPFDYELGSLYRRMKVAAKMREPEERRYFDEAVRPVLGGGIECIGEVGVDDKAEFLGAARAVLNPIQWPEPFGLVMIEALACGTPVLTHPRGAAPEIVDDGTTGFLCHDHDDMVRRIGDVDCLDRRACRAAVEERFSTARMVDDHISLYEQILAETTPPQHRNGSHPRPFGRRIGDPVRSGRGF